MPQGVLYFVDHELFYNNVLVGSAIKAAMVEEILLMQCWETHLNS